MLRLSPLCLALIVCLVGGCSRGSSPPPPTTHPAKGKIADRGGQPLTGGMVNLVSADTVPRTAMGEVGADGTFALFVMDVAGNKHPGAQEGEYSVTYIPVMSAAQTEVPVNLPAKFKIQPGENTLDLKLP